MRMNHNSSTFAVGKQLTQTVNKMRKNGFLSLLMLLGVSVMAQAQSNNTVTVVYNGDTATVSVADNVTQYLTVTQEGAHVSIAQCDTLATEITYTLSGTSTDGEFYMSGSYKATVELNGLTLTNTTPVYSGAAVHIQNSKRINVKVITGTTNTLVDAASGSQKGCLYVKGHAEFKQYGTLNVVGKCAEIFSILTHKVGGDDDRQLVFIAAIHHIEQHLLRPIRRLFLAKVIYHQDVC